MTIVSNNLWTLAVRSPEDGAGAGSATADTSASSSAAPSAAPSPAPSPTPDAGTVAGPITSETIQDIADESLGGWSSDLTGMFADHAEVETTEVEKLVPPVSPPTTQAAPTAQAAPQAPQAPTPQPIAPQVAQQPPGQQQAQTSPQAQAPEQSATQAAPLPHDLGALLQTFQQHEPTLIQAVAASEFQLSQEEVEALETDAVKAVPQLLAKNYVKTMKAMVHFMHQHMGTIIQDQVHQQSVQQEASREFFTAFPQLNPQQHANEIMEVGMTLRRLNPTMDRTTLLQRIGQTLYMMHGLAQPQPTQGQSQQVRQQVPPFVPAGSPARTMQPVQTAMPNGNDFFAGMSGDYDD